MSQRAQQRSQAPASSRTQTTTQSNHSQSNSPQILRLRGQHSEETGTSSERSVQWADDVVDNEGLGRKSSKVCCIYHRPRAVGESSDESSSSSDSDSDSDADVGHSADHAGKDHNCGHSHDHRHGRLAKKNGKQKRAPSPNAYEKVPKPKPRDNSSSAKS